MSQGIHRICVQLRQLSLSQPDTLTGFGEQAFQKAIQPPGNIDQHRFARNLTGYLAHVNRLARKDPPGVIIL